MIESIGFDVSQDAMDALVNAVDDDESGDIDYEELFRVASTHKSESEASQVS